jgi:DNA-binding transcriptional regulator YiaG
MTATALKQRRKALGLTQSALAAKIGVHEITVAKWETGAVPIPKPIALLMQLLTKTEGERKRG